jgi:UDPglucose 6-dehydrogenase
MKIAIIGLGCVGKAMFDSFIKKNMKLNYNIFVYDKYKDNGIGNIENCIKTDIVFLCLPTKYSNKLKEYNKLSIYNTCEYLSKNNYVGLVVIRSTIEPETCDNISKKYKNLNIVHNPEFLSAKTAFYDFHNQKNIIIGKTKNCHDKKIKYIENFYNKLYPKANIIMCSAIESESMKIFCNAFYSIKIQFFTELYLLCQKNRCNFNKIVNLMLINNWINPMHTKVPGNDGKISYGGSCFPKDTNALNSYMKKYNSLNRVLDSTIKERNRLRKNEK